MNKPKYTRMLFCCLVLTVGVWPSWAQPATPQTEPEQSSTLDVGRGNPFGTILKNQRASSQKQSQPSSSSEEQPVLLPETITLKFLDAKSTGVAFGCMSSAFGTIAVLEKTNSLIVFDTKENLERILAEIKKIDKPIPGLVVEAVTLKFLDAESAKTVLEKMSSEDGNITIVDKSNSLIICDRRKNLETILAELEKIDKPIQGLFVETVTLRFLDAKSAKTALEKMSSEYGSISIVERTNSLVICDTRKNLNMILSEIEKIDKPTSGLFVETATLKFLDAKNLKTVLDKMLSQYGSIAINDKTNSLIICDTMDNLAKILAEIKKADKLPQQLVIEAVILDVQLDDDTEIGVNWDILSDKMYDVTYRQNLGSRLSMVAATEDTIADTTAYNTTSLTGTEGGYFAVISGTVRNTIHLLQEKKNVEILASPRVMVVSGESASIETVREFPYAEIKQTSEGGELSGTEFKKVGVKLNVSATLTDDGYILVTVEPEQNVKAGESSGVPIIDTRTAKTTLLLKDGEVVVMGGLRRKETTNQRSQIPLLGDLPLIGVLFSKNQTVVKNSELLVILSPHIYKGEPIPEEVMAKYNEIKNKPMLSIPRKSEEDE